MDHEGASDTSLEAIDGIPNISEYQNHLDFQEPSVDHNGSFGAHFGETKGITDTDYIFELINPRFDTGIYGISCLFTGCEMVYGSMKHAKAHWRTHFQTNLSVQTHPEMSNRIYRVDQPCFKQGSDTLICLYHGCNMRCLRKSSFTRHWRTHFQGRSVDPQLSSE